MTILLLLLIAAGVAANAWISWQALVQEPPEKEAPTVEVPLETEAPDDDHACLPLLKLSSQRFVNLHGALDIIEDGDGVFEINLSNGKRARTKGTTSERLRAWIEEQEIR